MNKNKIEVIIWFSSLTTGKKRYVVPDGVSAAEGINNVVRANPNDGSFQFDSIEMKKGNHTTYL